MEIGLILNLVLCYFISKEGEKRTIGFWWSFFVCFILSPLIGLIVVLLTDKLPKEETLINKEEPKIESDKSSIEK